MRTLNTKESERYQRHISLPEFGETGQERLKSARVLVVGAGGLGSPTLLYLAAAGVGTIGIIDDDTVEISNLQRQILFSESDLGKPKAVTAAAKLAAMNSEIIVKPFPCRLSKKNYVEILNEFDLIIDGSDNFPTRYLINDGCVLLDKPFVSGSIFKFQGLLTVCNLKNIATRGPTYRCLFPTPPNPSTVPACAEIGVLGVLPGTIGALQATEAIKIITGIGEPLSGKLLTYNALTMEFSVVKYSRDEVEVGRVSSKDFIESFNYEAYNGETCSMVIKEISSHELKKKLDNKEDLQLVDVREPFERDIVNIGGDLIPMKTLSENLTRIARDKPVVIYCRSGGRSRKVCEELQEKHKFSNIINLSGGVLGWVDAIDPSLNKY